MVVTRTGEPVKESVGQQRFLSYLYRRLLGRVLLRLLRARWVSVCGGWLMDSRLSAPLARKAVRNRSVDFSGVSLPQGERTFRSFNAMFTRKRDAAAFPFCTQKNVFCAPADSRLTVLPLQDGTVFSVKQAPYTVAQLLGDVVEAAGFDGGHAFVFRLSVEDYHRYAYPDDGKVLSHRKLRGTLHTVNPVALETVPVFHRNTREVTLLQTAHFGRLAYVEVGAMLVGRIVNGGQTTFCRGDEKGYFAYGGSTVVLLTEKGQVQPDADLLQNSADGVETYVRAGTQVGLAVSK